VRREGRTNNKTAGAYRKRILGGRKPLPERSTSLSRRKEFSERRAGEKETRRICVKQQKQKDERERQTHTHTHTERETGDREREKEAETKLEKEKKRQREKRSHP
jgi:hypothetical protein